MAMDRFADILKKIRMRHPVFSKKLDEADAVARWEQCVGTAISNHTRAIRVEAQVLWVEVDHPAWKNELMLRKQQILDKLNQTPPEVPPQPPAQMNQRPRGQTTAGARPNAPRLEPQTIIDLLFLDPRKPYRRD